MSGEQAVDSCGIAQKKSIETALSYCESEQSRLELAGRMAGVTTDRMDTESVGDDVSVVSVDDPKSQRVWVAHRTYELIESGESPFDALDDAWDELDDHLATAALDDMADGPLDDTLDDPLDDTLDGPLDEPLDDDLDDVFDDE